MSAREKIPTKNPGKIQFVYKMGDLTRKPDNETSVK